MGDQITIHPDGDTLHLVSRTAEADLKVLTGKVVPEIVEDGEMIATLTGPVLKSLLRAGTFSSKDPKHSRPALEVVAIDFDGKSATAYAGDGNGLAVVTEILPQAASGLLLRIPNLTADVLSGLVGSKDAVTIRGNQDRITVTISGEKLVVVKSPLSAEPFPLDQIKAAATLAKKEGTTIPYQPESMKTAIASFRAMDTSGKMFILVNANECWLASDITEKGAARRHLGAATGANVKAWLATGYVDVFLNAADGGAATMKLLGHKMPVVMTTNGLTVVIQGLDPDRMKDPIQFDQQPALSLVAEPATVMTK
jgi:hypothetical protein